MMTTSGTLRAVACVPLCLILGTAARAGGADDELLARAARLAQELVIIDTHIDLPYQLVEAWEDVTGRTTHGDFDYARAREGGLDVGFMAIYVSSSLDGTAAATARADLLIDSVEALEARAPEKFAIVRTVSEIRTLAGTGKVLLALGMENGSPINGSLATLRRFYDRGIRYITLAHAKSNAIADASYDAKRPWKGLSPFGREVVREMNRLGMMVDISHLSDLAAEQILELSAAPVIASHSSCRYFTPGWERNISDELIGAVGRAGGVVQVNFGSEFLTEQARQYDTRSKAEVDEHVRAKGWKKGGSQARTYARQYAAEHPFPRATVRDVADHIDRVVLLAGIDHVGLGSDFDGVGDTLPRDLRDVAGYPALIAELLRRGYAEEDIAKICSGNILRVWQQVEDLAAKERSHETTH
jgi:membrane dipeptidase